MAWSVSDTASYCFIADRTDLVIRIQTYMKGRLFNPFIIGFETFFLNFQNIFGCVSDGFKGRWDFLISLCQFSSHLCLTLS